MENYIREMLKTIREADAKLKEERARLFEQKVILNEEENDGGKGISLPNDERFGETVKSLQQCVTKQLQGTQIKFEDDSLYFYPSDNDLIMTFTISDMNNMVVNFKLNDSNGQGCYISCENTQLNDENTKHIQQIKYAYDSWRQSLIEDDSIIKNIKSALLKK